MEDRQLNSLIRKSIYNVHNHNGPGLLENFYEEKLAEELQFHHLNLKQQVFIPVKYGEYYIDLGLRANIVVEDKIMIIIQSIEEISKKDSQYFRICHHFAGLAVGFLVNFNTYSIRKNVIRRVNVSKKI